MWRTSKLHLLCFNSVFLHFSTSTKYFLTLNNVSVYEGEIGLKHKKYGLHALHFLFLLNRKHEILGQCPKNKSRVFLEKKLFLKSYYILRTTIRIDLDSRSTISTIILAQTKSIRSPYNLLTYP